MLSCYGGMFERRSTTNGYSNGGVGSYFHKPNNTHVISSSISLRDSRLPPPISKSSAAGGDGLKFVNVPPVAVTRSTKVEANKALVAKSHKEAERRRRERINGHLSTLRTLLPNTNKTDKASLLAEVVRRVKELKKLAAGVTKSNNNGATNQTSDANGGGGEGEDYWAFPSDKDEIALEYCYYKIDNKDKDEDEEKEPESSPKKKKLKKTKTTTNKKMIKATFSCEDRSDLLQDLTKAIRSVRGKVMKAEMATIGGRTKGILVIRPPAPPSGGGGGQEEGNGNGGGEEIGVVRRALKSVVDKGTRNASNQGYYSANQNKRFRQYQ